MWSITLLFTLDHTNTSPPAVSQSSDYNLVKLCFHAKVTENDGLFQCDFCVIQLLLSQGTVVADSTDQREQLDFSPS